MGYIITVHGPYLLPISLNLFLSFPFVFSHNLFSLTPIQARTRERSAALPTGGTGGTSITYCFSRGT
jgi:hypothetical protein